MSPRRRFVYAVTDIPYRTNQSHTLLVFTSEENAGTWPAATSEQSANDKASFGLKPGKDYSLQQYIPFRPVFGFDERVTPKVKQSNATPSIACGITMTTFTKRLEQGLEHWRHRGFRWAEKRYDLVHVLWTLRWRPERQEDIWRIIETEKIKQSQTGGENDDDDKTKTSASNASMSKETKGIRRTSVQKNRRVFLKLNRQFEAQLL